MKLTKEYSILMEDAGGLVQFVGRFKTLQESYDWLESMSKKDKTKGLKTIRKTHYMIDGRPINWNRAVLWLNIILAVTLIFKLVSM